MLSSPLNSAVSTVGAATEKNIKYNEGRWQEPARRLANEINEIV